MRAPQTSNKPNISSDDREPTDSWSVPIFRWGRGAVTLSYSVFIVAAVVVGVSLNQAFGRSDRELVSAALLGISFWVSGWIVQSVAYWTISRLIGSPVYRIAIGPLGVKAAPRRWSPGGALAVALGSIAALIALASLYRLIDGGFQVTRFSIEPVSFWTMPSIGLSRDDAPWQAGAWICGVQAIIQMLPLSDCLGRQLLAALIALVAKPRSVAFQTQIFRQSLVIIALLGIAISIQLYVTKGDPSWMVVGTLALVLWISCSSNDTIEVFQEFQRQIDDSRPSGLRAGAKELIRTRQGRRRTKRALQREREEAEDASRLDEVLNRVKAHGADSLSKADRELLQRVSERVRKERDGDSSAG